jgi:hypothetical protein
VSLLAGLTSLRHIKYLDVRKNKIKDGLNEVASVLNKLTSLETVSLLSAGACLLSDWVSSCTELRPQLHILNLGLGLRVFCSSRSPRTRAWARTRTARS